MPKKDLTASLLRPEILAMSSYQVADADGLIKLDAMENPYGWPDDIKETWLRALKECPLNRYPDPQARQLAATLRRVNDVPESMELLLGNGSDEILLMLLMALPPDAHVLAPEPSFVMYRHLSRSLGLRYHGVALKPGTFDLDREPLLRALADYRPALTFLAYPNNPTGNLYDADSIRAVIAASPGLVVIDEAYAPFAGASFMADLDKYANLAVMRTVSKLGLAGLRLGYLAAPSALVRELDKIRLPYNVNSLTQLTADFALAHKDLFDRQTEKIRAERTRVFDSLSKLRGINPYPSAANFILFRAPQGRADAVFASLKRQGVLIKNLSAQGGLLTDCLRVTVGRPDENDRFLAALDNSL